MRSIIAGLLLVACSSSHYGTSRDTARQLNQDQRYAHSSSGDILYGPSYINERVVGQRDLAGNVHVTTDHYFLERADNVACLLMDLAQLAEERSSSPGVIRLAHALTADEWRVDQQVRSLAARRAFSLSGQLPDSDADAYARLAALSGDAFDRAFVDATLAYQREQLALFTDVARATNDRSLQELAVGSLPLLRASQAQAAREIDRL
jgi:predicted outer membrane protein